MAQRESRRSRNILKELRGRGGFWFKVWGNELMMAGLPDIIGCYRGLFIGFEVKHPETIDNTSARQLYVHALIHRAGGVAEVITTTAEAFEHLDRLDDRIDAFARSRNARKKSATPED